MVKISCELEHFLRTKFTGSRGKRQPAPLIAYKRNRNLKDILIRSKVPNLNRRRSKRQLKGMKKCGKCANCPFIKERNKLKSTKTNFSKEVNSSVDCSDSNVIYLIECTKNNCHEQYLGCTEQDFRTRMSQHREVTLTTRSCRIPLQSKEPSNIRYENVNYRKSSQEGQILPLRKRKIFHPQIQHKVSWNEQKLLIATPFF